MNDAILTGRAPELPMEDRPTERTGPAKLTNMGLALSTLLAAQEGSEGDPRLCMLYGRSGYGKSYAAAHSASLTTAAYIEAKEVWTKRAILEAIADELGIPDPARTSWRLFKQIVENFTVTPRPLIIDEMDHLVKKQMVEIIRDIHDATTIPIMMIGEEALPAKLKAWDRFDNRIIAATAAQPATAEDAIKLRDHYCLRVKLGADLVQEIADRSKGVTRRIVVNLRTVQRVALDDGQDAVDLAWWQRQGRPFLTGDLPVLRTVK